jgi:hypothetical protein
MANFLEPVIEPYIELLTKCTRSIVLKAETRLGMTDYDDIAKVAISAFQGPERLNGRAIGLVSEFLTQ